MGLHAHFGLGTSLAPWQLQDCNTPNLKSESPRSAETLHLESLFLDRDRQPVGRWTRMAGTTAS